MLAWLRAAGAEGLDNVEVKQTAYGGLGVFLVAPVETTSIARIPVECCVTATAVLRDGLAPGPRAAHVVRAGFEADGRYELEDHGAYEAGDVSWHHGWLLHSAADNRSPRDRLAVAVSFFASGACIIEEDGLTCVNDEDHPSYDDWLPDLAPGDVAAHELLPVVR